MAVLKYALFLLLLLVGHVLLAQNGLEEVDDFGNNPGKLKMFLHLPNLKNAKPQKRSLVVVLHGCFQLAEKVAAQSGWNKLADDYSFIVLYPQQRIINNASNCFNWFNKKDIRKDEGEIGSIKSMIDFAFSHYAIDSSKVFVYGLSAGAAMAVALLADYPAVFNMGASLAGCAFMAATNPFKAIGVMTNPPVKSSTEWGQLVKNQQPGYQLTYPKLLVMQGLNDRVVSPDNAAELIKQWSNLHQVENQRPVEIPAFEKQAAVKKVIYSDSLSQPVIIYYEIAQLGHSLPVNPGDGKYQGGETGNFATDIGFFSTYWIAVDFGLVKPE